MSHRRLPFPDSLAPSHRLYIDAVKRHVDQTAAANSLGISLSTLVNGLKKARLRAGVSTTDDLLALYKEAMTP